MSRIKRWGRLLTIFFMGQGLGQLLQLVSGFLLINWLSKDAYADYTLIIAIIGTTSMLVSLGFTECLTGLIGNKIKDARIVGRYLAACLYYRNRFLLLGALFLLGVLMYIGDRVGWSSQLSLVFWALVVIGLYFQAIQAVYSPVLLLQQRLLELYAVTLTSRVLRVGVLFSAYVCGFLSAPVAIAAGVLQELVAGVGKYWKARGQIEPPSRNSDLSAEKSEVLAQALPRVPSLVFTAFSGQMMVFLIGIYGTKGGIAEIGALSRLAMLFVVLRQSAGVIVGPYFAKLDSAKVGNRAMLLYAGLFGITLVMSVVVYLFPEPFLALLGEDYSHLKIEAFWVVLAALIRVSSMLVFSVCNARKIVFPWYSIADVLPQVLIIAFWVFFVDLSVLLNVLYFAVAMASSKLLSKSFILYMGLRVRP